MMVASSLLVSTKWTSGKVHFIMKYLPMNFIDESMQPWHSALFRDDSLTQQAEFAADLYARRNVSLYVLHSWTKIWSCTGLRLGSIICPTADHCSELKKAQVPWSVNTPALAFLDTVVKDDQYMQETWDGTSQLRLYLIEQLSALPASQRENFEYKGKEFLSWVWIDMKSEQLASEAVRLAKDAGVPVRSGQPGYIRPTHVRVAVREKQFVDVLIAAWKAL
jgi:histidinol-phosphate/aromatic aminotransferase/cobyric acid decarboxylase-like protein